MRMIFNEMAQKYFGEFKYWQINIAFICTSIIISGFSYFMQKLTIVKVYSSPNFPFIQLAFYSKV